MTISGLKKKVEYFFFKSNKENINLLDKRHVDNTTRISSNLLFLVLPA